MNISDKQREMLAFIENFIAENGYPPTYEEIRLGLGISTKSLVNYHLEALEEAALLTRSPNTPRGIRLSHKEDTIRVPVMTETAVHSAPTLTTERENQDIIELTSDIIPDGQNLYALKVQDISMLDALVTEGDIIIIQPQTQAKNGEMVAVRLPGQKQLTLRRYYRENGHVRLQPDNPLMKSILVKPEAVEIQGKILAVIRQID